jgi:predicted acyltransferase
MNQRFYSLDVFRGATVALMILVNNPGNWGHIYAPLDHASWHGCTPTDLVFPFFLFAVGNAMAFVMPRLEEKNIFWPKVLKRTALIFLIGIFLNWFPFLVEINKLPEINHAFQKELIAKGWTWHDLVKKDGAVMDVLRGVRIMGVLQRIALCYFFASVIVHFFKTRGSFVAAAVLLLGYWVLCLAAHPADPFSLPGWFGTKIDLAIVQDAHIYKGEGVPFDPEGLMSTFAAIAQVIFGYLVGHYIITKGKTPEMLNGLFVAGAVLVFCGFTWDMFFPINKKIWTSSYTIYTTGLALIILSVLIYVIEFKNRKGWFGRFFDVFGKNALFIFVLSGLLPRAVALVKIRDGLDINGNMKFLNPLSWFYNKVCAPLFTEPKMGSLLYAICFIAGMWFLAWLLDKKKIYIRV